MLRSATYTIENGLNKLHNKILQKTSSETKPYSGHHLKTTKSGRALGFFLGVVPGVGYTVLQEDNDFQS